MQELKVDKIKSLLNCGYCQNIYCKPVWLPCHETLCKKDIESLKSTNQEGNINCPFCEQIHIEPSDGFPADKKTLKLMSLEVNQIDFGEKFNKGKNLLGQINAELSRLQSLKNNPIVYIQKYFADIREHIHERKRYVDSINDEYSRMLLNEVDRHEEKCREISKPETETNVLQVPQDQLQSELNELHNKLKEWFGQFDQVALDENRRDQILAELNEVLPKLHQKTTSYEQKIVLGKNLRLVSEIISDEKIKAIFGHLKLEEIKKDSKKDSKKEFKKELKTPIKPNSIIKVVSPKRLESKRDESFDSKISTKRFKVSMPFFSTSSSSTSAAKKILSLSENEIFESIFEILEDFDEDFISRKKFSPAFIEAIVNQVASKYPEHNLLSDKIKIKLIKKILKEIEHSKFSENNLTSKNNEKNETIGELLSLCVNNDMAIDLERRTSENPSMNEQTDF